MNQTPEQIMRSALEAFGTARQVDKCLEELGELAAALIQYRNGRISIDELRGEIADVQVIGGQMRLLYGAAEVDAIAAVKLRRLEKLVADQVQANAEKPKGLRCGGCVYWGARGTKNPVGACQHPAALRNKPGTLSPDLCSLPPALNPNHKGELAAPKPVKPVLRWEREGDDGMTLYNGEEVGGVSWWPALAKWVGNPYGKTAVPYGDKADAKRHVEMACGFDEVPLWTP